MPLRTFLTLVLITTVKSALVSSLSSYLTLTSTNYLINMTFSSTTIPSGSNPTLTLSTRYSINSSNLLSCSAAITSSVSYSIITCSAISNSASVQIIFSAVYPSNSPAQTKLSLKFTINNPWAATTETYSLAILSGVTSVVSDSSTISYSAAALSNCGWSSQSSVNGATGVRTVSFTPSVPVVGGSFLSISLPFWFSNILNLATSSPTCTAITNVDSTPTCSNTTSGFYEIYQVRGLFSSNKTVPGAVSLNISAITNPYSTYPFGPITYNLVYSSAGSQYISQTCSGITQTTTTLNSLVSFGISFFSFISLSSTNRNGWFKISNPLPALGGQLHISWSGGVSISFTASSASPSMISLNSSLLVLGNFTSDYYSNANISIFAKFNVVAPKSSRTFTITATTYYLSGSNSYGIDSKTNSYNCLAGSLSPATVQVTNTSLGAITSLKLTITLGHAVYSGSYIGVTFPIQVTTTSGSSCSSDNSLITCSVTSNNYGNLSVTGTVALSTTVTITFNTVTNPGQAVTTSSFSVTTYIDQLLDGIIDTIASGLILTYGANQLSISSVHILPSSTTTYSPTNYTFSVTLVDPIPAGGRIELVFPPTITLASPSLLSASFPTTTCNSSTTTNNFTLSNCFASDLSILSVFMVVGGITNPSSLAPTSSFAVYTYGALGVINYLDTGVTVTMTTLVTSTSFSVSALSLVVYDTTTYTFSLAFYGTPTANYYLSLELPIGMAVSGTPTCTPISGIASLTCNSPNSTNIKVTMVAVPANSISFSVSNLQNYQVSSTPVDLYMITYDSNNYGTEQTPITSLTFTPTSLSATTNHNDQLALNQASNVTLTLTAPFTLSSGLSSSLTSIEIALPSEITTLTNTSCSSGSLTCTLFNNNFSISSVGLSISNLQITLLNVFLNFNSGSSSSFAIQFSYNSAIIAAVSTGVTINGYCTLPCQQCQNTSSLCLSCLPSPNTFTLYYSPNSTCLSSCPSGYYSSGGICVVCQASCTTCNSSSTCQSCASSYFFYNLTCTNSCPSGTYLTTTTCSTCSTTCLTCNNTASFCLSCSSSTVLSGSSCLSSCPVGTFNSSGSCVTCTPNCVTCNSTSLTCMVCNFGYYLYQGLCYSPCPSSAPVPDITTLTCTQCGTTCTACTSDGSYCNTCNTGLVTLQGQCLTTCPDGYQLEATTNTCTVIKYIRTIYYPASIVTAAALLIVVFAKMANPSTNIFGNSVTLISFGSIASTIIVTVACFSDQTLPGRLLTLQPSYTSLFATGIALIAISILLGSAFVLFLCCKLDCDAGLSLWRSRNQTNKYVLNSILVLTLVRVGVLRMSYCQLFGRQCFSCYVRANGYFLKITNWFSILNILLCCGGGIGFALIFIVNSLGNTQTQIYAIDLLIICSLQAVALLFDMCLRSRQHFRDIIQSLPYLRKFRKHQDLQSSDGSLISIHAPQEAYCRTQVQPNRPSVIPIGGFGAFSDLGSQDSAGVVAKTLPEFNQVKVEVAFDPYQQKRKNDQLFFQQRQYTRKFNQLKESYQHEQSEISPRGEQNTQHEQQLNPINTVEEIINQAQRDVNPADYLQQISSHQYRQIEPKEIEFLDRVADQRGVDPSLMRNLFGVNKHYNPQLLSSTIDDQAVPSEAVRHLINHNNSPAALQSVFGKNSSVSAQDINKILKDPQHEHILSALFGKEAGIFTVQALQKLISSFSPSFLRTLLTADQVDKQKLKTLLDSCRKESHQLEALTSLQKIGGQNLEDRQFLRNTISQDAQLDPKLIPKVSRQMSPESRKTIFHSRSPATSTMIRKVINNKQISLNKLDPIQEMPELVQELAQLLNSGNQKVSNSITEVLEEGNYDGQELKELISHVGNGQQQINNLLAYIHSGRGQQNTPVQQWPSTPPQLQVEEDEESANYLDFDVDVDERVEERKERMERKDSLLTPPRETGSQWRQSKAKVRLRRKELPEVHLPSQQIYLQRLHGTRGIQKKNTRIKRKKGQKPVSKFMDEQNEVYDLDF